MMLGRQQYTQHSHTAPLVSRCLLKRLKGESPGVDQISTKSTTAEGRKIRNKIHKIVNSIWNKEGLPELWKYSNIASIYKKSKKQILIVIETYHFCQIRTTFYPTSCFQGWLHMKRKFWGIISVDFDAIQCQMLIIYSAFVRYSKKKGIQWKRASASGRPMIQLERRFCITFSLCLVSNETSKANTIILNGAYSRVRGDKLLADMFVIRMVWIKEMFFFFCNCFTTLL